MDNLDGMQPGLQPVQQDHATRATDGATIATSGNRPTRGDIERARVDFVERGRSLTDISAEHGIALGTLKARSARDHWANQRETFLRIAMPGGASGAMGDYATPEPPQPVPEVHGHKDSGIQGNSLKSQSDFKGDVRSCATLSQYESKQVAKAQPAAQPDDPADATVAAAMLAAIRESRVPAIRTIRDLQVAQSIYHKAIGRDKAGPGGGARAVNVFLLGHATPATLPTGKTIDAEVIPG